VVLGAEHDPEDRATMVRREAEQSGLAEQLAALALVTGDEADGVAAVDRAGDVIDQVEEFHALAAVLLLEREDRLAFPGVDADDLDSLGDHGLRLGDLLLDVGRLLH
jgi:hypothetical protein